jgi:hypothetical protein
MVAQHRAPPLRLSDPQVRVPAIRLLKAHRCIRDASNTGLHRRLAWQGLATAVPCEPVPVCPSASAHSAGKFDTRINIAGITGSLQYAGRQAAG